MEHNAHSLPALEAMLQTHDRFCMCWDGYKPSTYGVASTSSLLTNFLSFSRCSVKPGSCLAWLNVTFASCTNWLTREAPAEFAIDRVGNIDGRSKSRVEDRFLAPLNVRVYWPKTVWQSADGLKGVLSGAKTGNYSRPFMDPDDRIMISCPVHANTLSPMSIRPTLYDLLEHKHYSSSTKLPENVYEGRRYSDCSDTQLALISGFYSVYCCVINDVIRINR